MSEDQLSHRRSWVWDLSILWFFLCCVALAGAWGIANAESAGTFDYIRVRSTTIPSTCTSGSLRFNSGTGYVSVCKAGAYVNIADISTSQTLTNKTMSGASNTFTNIPLSSAVTGTLPIANGGTNNASLAVTAGGVVYTDGSKLMNVGAGTSGQVLTSAGASAPTWAAASGGGGSGVNVLSSYNPKAETGDTTSWSETGGGTLTVTSTAANVGNGSYAFSYDASAANDYASSTAATIPAGLYGQSCLLEFYYKGFDANITAQVHDGTNVIASQTLVAATNYQIVRLNFICPTSGTIQMRILAGADAAIGYWDEVHLGSATNFASGGIIQDLGSETWTDNQANATTSVRLTRVGNRVFVEGVMTFSGAASGQISLTIPATYTPDSSTYSNSYIQDVGQWSSIDNNVNTATKGTISFQIGSPLTIDFYANLTSSTYPTIAATSATVPHTWASPDVLRFYANWVVSGWQASTFANVSSTPGMWSGYHDVDCNFARSSSTLGTFTADGSCTFTELQNVNFPTVSSTGSKTPGITFTPTATGRYLVMAQFSCGMTTGAVAYESHTCGLSTDGSTIDTNAFVGKQAESGGGAASAVQSDSIATIINVTSLSAVSWQFLGKSASGNTLNILAPASGYGRPINWTVIYLGAGTLSAPTPSISSWTSFTPTISHASGGATNYTTSAYWRRVGDEMEVRGTLTFSSSSAAYNALYVTIPNSNTIDTTKLTSATNMPVGIGTWFDASGSSWPLYVLYESTTKVQVRIFDDNTGGNTYNNLGETTPVTHASGDKIQFSFSAPITGWN